jgi:hypothetical protein
MPATTKIVAAISNQNFATDGWSGGRILPRRQSSFSSAATPIATTNEQTHANVSQFGDDPSRLFIELSKAEMELLKADMELSRAEESAGKVEWELAQTCIITAISLFLLGATTIIVLAIWRIRNRF